LVGRRLQRDVESALFRVAQEALGNAHRHSGGTRIQVMLATSVDGSPRDGPSAVLLAVEDDGHGFAGGQAATAANDSDPALFGVGLAGMRERMRQLGGRLNIRSADPSGTLVEAWVLDGAVLGSAAARPIGSRSERWLNSIGPSAPRCATCQGLSKASEANAS
jgi:signal transduction histidine kinase